MKTYKNLFAQIYPFPNLYLAFQAARQGKRNRAAVASFEFDLESNLYGCATSAEREYARSVPGWAAAQPKKKWLCLV